jgi:hypothetical protein
MLSKVVEQAFTNCSIENECIANFYAPSQEIFDVPLLFCVLYEEEYLEVPENFMKLIF